MTEPLAIDLQNVAKVYRGRIHALQGIDMLVRRGEIFGLLGPNGAGKSTLVKIMMSVVRPTRAHGTLLGAPVGHKPTLARVGYLPESHRFPRYLTGRQALEFFAALSNVDRRTRRHRAARLLDTVGMTDWADRKIATYSKGMMQRVGLAQALAADPELVVLDEPTDGVDPVGRKDIRDVLAGLREQGKTVFVNSHLLSELEMICDRVAILVNGKVARQGTVDELSVATQRYEIEAAGAIDPAAARLRILQCLGIPTTTSPATGANHRAVVPASIDRGKLATGQWIELQGAILRLGTTDAADVQPILDNLRAAEIVIRRVQLVRPSLEELFIEAVATPSPRVIAPENPIVYIEAAST